MARKDFLDEIVSERTARNPSFPRLVEEAAARRALAKELAKARQALHLSQTQVAAKMDTSASVVSKLESGADVKFSTYQRYCAAIRVPLPMPAASSVGRRHPARARTG